MSFQTVTRSTQGHPCLRGPPQIATEMGSSVEEVREDARGILEEMSQNLQLGFIRLMAYTVTKVLKRLFSSVYVNVEGLNMVRTERHPPV